MPRTPSQKSVSKSGTPTLTTRTFGGATSLFQQSPYTYSSEFPSSPPNFSSPSETNLILSPSFPYPQHLPTGHADARLLYPNRPTSPLATSEGYKAIFLTARDFPDKKKNNGGEDEVLQPLPFSV